MVIQTTLETVPLLALVDNEISTKWFDYGRPKDYLKEQLFYKRPYVSQKGALQQHPDKHVTLNGKSIIDIIKALGNETTIECYIVPNVTEENIADIINELNKERNLKDWEKCEKALTFLPPDQQGKYLGGKTKWKIAIEKSGVDISEDTIQRYDRAKTFDAKTNQQYKLVDRIKGVGLLADQEPMTISAANTIVSRHQKKETLRQEYPDKKIHVEPIWTDKIQDYDVWLQDNREEWLIEDNSVQLIPCSPHYFNQRKYTEENVMYEAQTLPEYLNDLLLAFTQAKKKLTPDGVLCVNIADTHKLGENYMVIQRFCLDLADKLGFTFIFKQIWCKTNGLAKGFENRVPTYDYEEILYFSKSKTYYFKPIEINDLEKDIVVAYYNGRQNPNGSMTNGKWMVSKEYETFNQFIHQSHFENVIITGTASAESRAITEKYGEKHPAVMPLVIPLYPILCFTKPGDIVFDPWTGSGTTLKVALATGRKARGIDLEQRFVDIARSECQDIVNLFVTD